MINGDRLFTRPRWNADIRTRFLRELSGRSADAATAARKSWIPLKNSPNKPGDQVFYT